MEYRKFGNTDLLTSEVGFGAWAIGGGAMVGTTAIGWGETDDVMSEKAIHASIERGVNFFDTADIYGLGHSEELLGKTIGHRQDIIIATKVGNVSRDEKFTVDYSKEYIIQACEKSLQRLRRDAIEYYQLHTARIAHLENGECIDAMQQLQQQGKIRYWGLSLNTFDPAPEAEWIMEKGYAHGFQLVLNILNQKALDIIKNGASNGYGIIARMPLQFGLLTGKFDNGVAFSVNDHRKNRLTPQLISAANTALDPVWKLCKKYGCTKTQLAMSYILSYAEVSTVIPGIRTIEQASLNTTGIFQLDAADRALIEELGAGSFVTIMEQVKALG